MTILDYSNFTEEKRDELDVDFFQPLSSLIQTGFFESTSEYCRFCSSKLNTPLNEIQDGGGGYDVVEIIYDCLNCGWWYYKNEESTYIGEGDSWHRYEYKYGILRKYTETSRDLPIMTLRNELCKHPELIYGINPTNFEKLVGSVFKDFFNCEVHHVGKSNDGGIDLILVRSDNDTVIQVKRKENPNTTEGVRVIRELIGAMLLSEKRNGIFVSTAAKFSKSSYEAINKAKRLSIVDKIELLDCNKFIDIMGLTSKSVERPWQKVFKGNYGPRKP